MASAPPSPPPSSLDVELSPPVLVTMDSSSSDIEEENVNLGFESPRGFDNLGYAVFNLGQLLPRQSFSELCINCFGVVLVFCFFASAFLIGSLYGPKNVWLGPNSSILAESNSIFVKNLKVKEIDDTKAGLQLFRFYRSPPLDAFVNWSESRLLSISHDSYKGWPFYLNKGSSLNISYNVKPHGSEVQFVVNKGLDGMISQSSSNGNALQNTAWSRSLIQGNGKIEFEISQSSSYYVAVVNLERNDVEVELDIAVRAVLYDTKQSFYNCTLGNGLCTFNATSLIRHSVVVTSPAPSQGVSLEDEWHIMFSYEPRWSAYVISTGMVICFTLVALCFCNKLQCCGGETDNDLARTRLLANKDDDGSSMGSCSDDDADLEEVIGKDGEASNSSRRSCVICFDAPRDCFFLPCGHCVSCYQCGTKIAEGDGSCPLCRRRMKKVKRIYIA